MSIISFILLISSFYFLFLTYEFDFFDTGVCIYLIICSLIGFELILYLLKKNTLKIEIIFGIIFSCYFTWIAEGLSNILID